MPLNKETKPNQTPKDVQSRLNDKIDRRSTSDK